MTPEIQACLDKVDEKEQFLIDKKCGGPDDVECIEKVKAIYDEARNVCYSPCEDQAEFLRNKLLDKCDDDDLEC